MAQPWDDDERTQSAQQFVPFEYLTVKAEGSHSKSVKSGLKPLQIKLLKLSA